MVKTLHEFCLFTIFKNNIMDISNMKKDYKNKIAIVELDHVKTIFKYKITFYFKILFFDRFCTLGKYFIYRYNV